MDRVLVTESETSLNTIISGEDQYDVSAQGLAGIFKPCFLWDYTLYDDPGEHNSGKYSGGGHYDGLSNSYFDNRSKFIRFRFVNDQGGGFPSYVSGSTDADYNSTDWYTRFDYPVEMTNVDIRSSKIIRPAIDLERGTLLGFEITAEDGKIYEFYQPVFFYFSYTYSEKKGASSTSRTEMTTPYATSWLLTGIKGPDYIDRGITNGGAEGFSADDWGFWVKFRYKNLGLVPWRAPFSGLQDAPDPNYSDAKTISEGIRDAIYLATIETATHIGIFQRGDRIDNESVAE